MFVSSSLAVVDYKIADRNFYVWAAAAPWRVTVSRSVGLYLMCPGQFFPHKQ